MAVSTRKKTTSKGSMNSVAVKTSDTRTYIDDINNKLVAWKKMQNPWLTIENPNPKETNKRFIKVQANQYWGNPRPKKGDKVQADTTDNG
jgi:hypothetical protein